MSDLDFLHELASTIRDRLEHRPDGSYVAKLAAAGPAAAAKKLGEEGVEAALAAVTEDRSRLLEESADLLFHLIVLLELSGATLDEVAAVLKKRHVAG